MHINPDATYKKNKDIISRRIAGETLLVPIRGRLADMQNIFALEGVAEYIWQQLDNERGIPELLDGVLKTFDVEKEQAKTDINEFLTELLEASLVVESA